MMSSSRQEEPVPEISRFFGIVIQMFWSDHAPPHFHAVYGEHEALIDIRTLEIIRGSLPRRVLGLTLEWAAIHRAELTADWVLCQNKIPPAKIPPLE
jgi:hypothetical protein